MENTSIKKNEYEIYNGLSGKYALCVRIRPQNIATFVS